MESMESRGFIRKMGDGYSYCKGQGCPSRRITKEEECWFAPADATWGKPYCGWALHLDCQFPGEAPATQPIRCDCTCDGWCERCSSFNCAATNHGRGDERTEAEKRFDREEREEREARRAAIAAEFAANPEKGWTN
jgi:hypothetical protein